jgi:hypothetical protein
MKNVANWFTSAVITQAPIKALLRQYLLIILLANFLKISFCFRTEAIKEFLPTLPKCIGFFLYPTGLNILLGA